MLWLKFKARIASLSICKGHLKSSNFGPVVDWACLLLSSSFIMCIPQYKGLPYNDLGRCRVISPKESCAVCWILCTLQVKWVLTTAVRSFFAVVRWLDGSHWSRHQIWQPATVQRDFFSAQIPPCIRIHPRDWFICYQVSITVTYVCSLIDIVHRVFHWNWDLSDRYGNGNKKRYLLYNYVTRTLRLKNISSSFGFFFAGIIW